MTMTAELPGQVPWWKEPTKDQWVAWIAAWLGWMLDAFDFTIFLLIMLPISQEFGVPLTAVTAVFAVTLWLRLLGATAAGWMADHMGRRAPLMISILWYSLCNFIAGFSPTFGGALIHAGSCLQPGRRRSGAVGFDLCIMALYVGDVVAHNWRRIALPTKLHLED